MNDRTILLNPFTHLKMVVFLLMSLFGCVFFHRHCSRLHKLFGVQDVLACAPGSEGVCRPQALRDPSLPAA